MSTAEAPGLQPNPDKTTKKRVHKPECGCSACRAQRYDALEAKARAYDAAKRESDRVAKVLVETELILSADADGLHDPFFVTEEIPVVVRALRDKENRLTSELAQARQDLTDKEISYDAIIAERDTARGEARAARTDAEAAHLLNRLMLIVGVLLVCIAGFGGWSIGLVMGGPRP